MLEEKEMSRKSKAIPLKPIVLVYCEGDSEKAYFEMLRHKYHARNVHAIKVEVSATGMKGMALMVKAQAKMRQAATKKKIDQVYVVFDRDELSKAELKKCEDFGKEHDIQIVFSSINIEVWILMHFEPVFRSYSTLELNQKLSSSKYFNLDYEHFKGQPYDHFLFDRVNIAVTNAQKLRNQQKGLRWYDRDPFTNIDQYLTDIFGVTEY